MHPTPHNTILFELHFDAKFPLYVFYNFDLSDLNSTTYNNNININMVFESSNTYNYIILESKNATEAFLNNLCPFFSQGIMEDFFT